MKTREKPSKRRLNNKPLTTARLSLLPGKGENHSLGRLSFMLQHNRLIVSVIGFDRPGILVYLTGKFLQYGANVESCYGERLKTSLGSYFEITVEDKSRLVDLCNEFMSDDTDFRGKENFVPAKFADLNVMIRRDEKGLLHRVSSVLFEENSNITYFWEHTLDDFLLNDDPTDLPPTTDLTGPEETGESTGPFRWQVSIIARLELPEGVDIGTLKKKIREVCPPGSNVELRERPYGVQSHQPVCSGLMIHD